MSKITVTLSKEQALYITDTLQVDLDNLHDFVNGGWTDEDGKREIKFVEQLYGAINKELLKIEEL